MFGRFVGTVYLECRLDVSLRFVQNEICLEDWYIRGCEFFKLDDFICDL